MCTDVTALCTDINRWCDPTPQGIDLNEVYERLDEIGSDEAIARAGGILGGLGFDGAMQHQATNEFSGGWRMRISLAQVYSTLHFKP